MKKFSFFALLAVAAFAVGCSEDVDNGGSSMEHKLIDVSFGVDIASEDSRSEVDLVDGKVQGNWELDTDKIGVFSAVDQNKEFAYGDNKLFNGQLTEAAEYTLQAYYPYGADYAEGTTVTIPFGVERPQDGGKFNSAYDILFSEPKTTSELDGHTFDFVRPLSVLNFDTSAAGAFRYARLTDLDGGLLSTGGLTFEMGANPTLMPVTADHGGEIVIADAASTIWVDLGSEAAHADVFFNVLPGNYNLKLDLLTEDGKISSTTIDRTNAEKPFEAGKFYYKKVSGEFVATAAPSVVWPDGNGGFMDMDAAHEITVDEDGLTYPAALEITAPAGIQMMGVAITSDYLSMMLGFMGLDASGISLVPVNDFDNIGMYILPGGAAYHHAFKAVFDVTNLIPIIAEAAPDSYGTHIFTLLVKDAAGRITMQDLTFTLTEPEPVLNPTATYNNDANYWTNKATFALTELAADAEASFQYRIKGAAEWKNAVISEVTAENTATATIQATWTENTAHRTGTAWNVDNTTGIFAGNDYEWKFVVNGEVRSSGEIASANSGATIADSNFEDANLNCFLTYKTKNDTSGNKNATNWCSGNFAYYIIGSTPLASATLCKQASYTDVDGNSTNVVKMETTQTYGLPAAGNLFMGTFYFASLKAYVDFGQKFDYKGARPYALAFDYDAVIGASDVSGTAPSLDGETPEDVGVIYVCIVDWSSRHQVSAGTDAPVGAWRPDRQQQINDDHKIIACGYMEIPRGTTLEGQLQHCELVLDWYDHDTTAAPSGNYTLFISCATNKWGDYKWGTIGNTIYIDNFEWVY